MKKPELYTQQRRHGNDDIRVRINPYKFAVWNSTYYRSKGKRKRYVIKERKLPSYYYGRQYKYTRWQLDYDLKKPWHVDCTFPKDFATFDEAITYANSKQAQQGPFKYNLNEPIKQEVLFDEST